MQRIHKTIAFAAILSEISHVFCCVLPTIFTALSLLAAVGMIGVIPYEVISVHEFLHAWELPIIGGSGLILAIGWALSYYSYRLDCRAHAGCGHPPCAPKKSRTQKILIVATILFAVNLSVYLVVHRGLGITPAHPAHEAAVSHSHE